MLAGRSMYVRRQAASQKKYSRSVEVVDCRNPIVRIGHNSNSETLFLTAAVLGREPVRASAEEEDEEEAHCAASPGNLDEPGALIGVDVPGFRDNRGTLTEMSNCIGTTAGLQRCSGVVFMYLLDAPGLANQAGEAFR